ncbi:MAG: hypothetical protein ACLFQX_02020 [Candidatus Kapaibacterium sp.]
MNSNSLISLLFALIAGIAIGWLINSRNAAPPPPAEIEIIRDTVVKVRRPEPIYIEKIRTKVIEKRDTLLLTPPFTALIDTVWQRDTIFASYDFPENLMSLRVIPAPDSLAYVRENIIRTVQRDRPWWEATAMVGGGAAIGALLVFILNN